MKHSMPYLLAANPHPRHDQLVLYDLASTVTAGSIPAGLGNLSHLKILNLKWNRLSGDTPITSGRSPLLLLNDAPMVSHPMVSH